MFGYDEALECLAQLSTHESQDWIESRAREAVDRHILWSDEKKTNTLEVVCRSVWIDAHIRDYLSLDLDDERRKAKEQMIYAEMESVVDTYLDYRWSQQDESWRNDIKQTVSMNVWRDLHKYRFEGFRAWIRVITRNKTSDQHKRDEREKLLLEPYDDSRLDDIKSRVSQSINIDESSDEVIDHYDLFTEDEGGLSAQGFLNFFREVQWTNASSPQLNEGYAIQALSDELSSTHWHRVKPRDYLITTLLWSANRVHGLKPGEIANYDLGELNKLLDTPPSLTGDWRPSPIRNHEKYYPRLKKGIKYVKALFLWHFRAKCFNQLQHELQHEPALHKAFDSIFGYESQATSRLSVDQAAVVRELLSAHQITEFEIPSRHTDVYQQWLRHRTLDHEEYHFRLKLRLLIRNSWRLSGL